MSGRIRSIKPEWLEDERMALASDAARVLSIALILCADDEGRGVANPTLLGAKAFPVNPQQLQPALTELRPWFVRLYRARGQTFFEVTNWKKHQRIDRPTKSRLPKPEEGELLGSDSETLRDPITEDSASDSRSFVESSGESRASRVPDPLPSIPGPDPDPTRADDESKAALRRALPDAMATSFAVGTEDDHWVFGRWVAAFGKTGADFDPGRCACLAERRLRGMTRQDAEDALAGAKLDPYVTGEKDGKKHDRLSFIFGDAERFEEFRDAGRLARLPELPPRSAPRRAPPVIEGERKPIPCGVVPDFVTAALSPKAAGAADA